MSKYPVFEQQTRLECIADLILNGISLNNDDRYFLASALRDVARGNDANQALGVKAGKGQRNSYKERMKIVNIQLAMGWVATAIEPKLEGVEADNLIEGGLGLTVEEACYEASQCFNLSYDTLMHEWGNRPAMRKREFKIFYHPAKLKRTISAL